MAQTQQIGGSNPKWLIYAIASGGCAALNGVFAKLTTTTLTSTWATGISHFLGFSESSAVVEFLVRGFFFLMNLAFNAVMWGLFTRALTLASSTVRVSVINTSANFTLAAVLGTLIFGEGLPGLWWIGAAMLVAGSVIIGRREEGNDVDTAGTVGIEPPVAAMPLQEAFRDEPDAPIPAVRDGVEGDYRDSIEMDRNPRKMTVTDGDGEECD